MEPVNSEHNKRLWDSWPSNLTDNAVMPACAMQSLLHLATRTCIDFFTHDAHRSLARQLAG